MIATRTAEYRTEWRAKSLHGGITIAQEIARAAQASPDLTLRFAGAEWQEITFAEIAQAMDRHARGLLALGLVPGDTVAVQAPHSRDNMLFFAAAMRLGLRYVPIVSIYEATEIDFILTQTGAKAIAVPATSRNADITARIRALRAPDLQHVIVLDGKPVGRDYGRTAHRFADITGAGSLPAADDPHAPAIILYTSGSTGVAKGAVHSHESALAELRAAATYIAQTGHAPLLSPLPTGHVAGIMAMLRPFVHSVPTVYMAHWDVAEAARLIAEHAIGSSYGTPFHLLGLLKFAETGAIPTLKAYQIGGAGVPTELIRRADALGIAACRGYGCTEHPTITASLPHDPLAKRSETDGRAMAGVSVKLVNDDGKPVPDGEPGEIVATGPEQFLGYLDETCNAGAFDDDGWFRTGDIGVRDADGFIAIVDRKKDIIIRAGENIAPKEVEDVLMRHPAIGEAAVVGVPDPTYGERVAAVVILREGTLDLEELKRHFRSTGIAIQKTPEKLVIVDEFPRTPLGKIHKRNLRDSILNLVA